MLKHLLIAIFLIGSLPINLFAQVDWSWHEVPNTPGTEAVIKHYFSNGGLLAYVNASEQLAISDDKGETWRFGESGDFLDASTRSYVEDQNGNFYFTANLSKQFYQVDRHTMELRLVHTSSNQVFLYAASEEHLFMLVNSEIRKVRIDDGTIVDSYFSNNGSFSSINISQDNEILALTSTGYSILLDEDFKEITLVEGNQLTSIDKRLININNQMVRMEVDGFSITDDYGLTWLSVEVKDLFEYDGHLGNDEFYAVVDSTIYVYDIHQKIWKDTFYLNTYMQLQGATDHAYLYLNSNEYPWVVHYLSDESEFLPLNNKIGPPDTRALIALNDSNLLLASKSPVLSK